MSGYLVIKSINLNRFTVLYDLLKNFGTTIVIHHDPFNGKWGEWPHADTRLHHVSNWTAKFGTKSKLLM